MSLSATQHSIKRSMLAGIASIAAVAYLTVTMPAWSITQAVALHFIWAYALVAVGIWLPVMIGIRATERFFDTAQIDGSMPVSQRSAINARVLQNTIEQTILAVLADLLLVLSNAHHAAMLLIAHAALFSVGRGLFWWGYHYQPAARAYGFTLTFYSSVAIYLYAASFLLRALFAT